MTGHDEWDNMMAWLAPQLGAHAALARDQLQQLSNVRDALLDRDDEVHDLRQQLAAHREMLTALGAVLDVAGRAVRAEATAHDLISTAVDCSAFRNLMSTIYGLGPVGETLPPKRSKSRRAAS